jgi:hypothetical protein
MAEWTVPGYTALKKLGSGGFGDVVLARHDASGTLVAIKYLKADLLDDPGFCEMFRSEASVLAQLDDPNVVRLYEYVESPSGAAIVMELVDGASLRMILARQGQTTPEAALVVLQGSLLGLAAAHQRGIVHRDYKPENVLVNGNGVSKLTDFGIAVRAGDRPHAAGTIAYAPPEQMSGGPATPAGDVYAATATFYECLTGRPPFTGETAERVMYQHLFEPVPLEPVPAPLRPLVEAGMAKEPERRPTDGTTFITALRAAAVGVYGADWEERGRSHLGEAALLLAALWPLGAPAGVHGFAAEQVALHPGAQESRHLHHLHHIWHLEHLRHLAHLRHLRRLDAANAALVTAAAVAVVAAAVTFGFKPSANTHPVAAPVHSVPLSPGSPPTTSPAVTGLSPASGSTGGGTLVTITGTRLDGPVTVKFGGKAGTITVDLNTKIVVKSPPGKGTVEITVTTPGGTSSAGEFSYHSPQAHLAAPAVSGVFPASGPAAGGTSVTVSGTGLADATLVSFGGAAGTITADSGTQITVTSPPGNGTVGVEVTTPGGSSAGGMFTYTAASALAPAVTGISPASGPAGGGTSVTITGTNLSGATKVSFASAAGTITSDSGTKITAKSPAGTGTVTVTVTTPGGTATAGKFTYNPAATPAPTVTGISPTSGTTAGGTSVKISGKNLSGATAVSFGSAGDGKITADSSTQVTATSPAGSAGTVNVTVTTKGGTSATSKADEFTYVAPAPSVTGISPDSGLAAGGTSVTITGKNLSGATGVGFGSYGDGKITADSSTQITVTTPAGSGTVNITVTTPGGTSATSNADQFTYIPAPTVTSISPEADPPETTVTIYGTNLSGATGVSFGGVAATSVTVVSSTEIEATTPEGDCGANVSVTVTTPGGTATSPEDFTYTCIS